MGGGYLRLTKTSTFCIIKKNRNILRIESRECMKYLKIGILTIISFCIGLFPVQALTWGEVQDLQGKGDIYGLINYQEVFPTETTPYRITVKSPFEKYPNEVVQVYIKISEEEYNTLKFYQKVMDQHQQQYSSVFEPLWIQTIDIQAQIYSKGVEYRKLESLLQQETEEEEKKQIQEQMNQIDAEIEQLYSEAGAISLQIEEQAKKIDNSVKEAITKMYEFVNQKDPSDLQAEITNEKTIELSSPGYYWLFSLLDVSPINTDTYGDLAPSIFGSVRLIEAPETPKEEVVEEPDIENPSTGIQNIIMGGGMVLICSITGMYFIRKKKLFVK